MLMECAKAGVCGKWYPELVFIVTDTRVSMGAGLRRTQVWVCSVHCSLYVCAVCQPLGKPTISHVDMLPAHLCGLSSCLLLPQLLRVTFPIVLSHSASSFPFASSDWHF